METRKVTLKNGKIQTEQYLECKNCGVWKWTTAKVSTTCAECIRDSRASNKGIKIRSYTKKETDMIKNFLKQKKPSVVISLNEDNFKEVSSCYPSAFMGSSKVTS